MSRLLLIGAMTAVSIATANAQSGAAGPRADHQAIVSLPAAIGADAVDTARKLWIGDAMSRLLSGQTIDTGRSVSADRLPGR